jgi:hypothetical protein
MLLDRSLALVASVLTGACTMLDAPDHVRAYRARGRIQKGMTLPLVFDELSQVHSSGQWPGLLSGSSCNVDGQKRTWVLSREDAGYLVVTHVEDATSPGQADWKESALPDRRAVHAFLSQPGSGSCSSYWSNFGRWGFGMALAARNQRVREVRPLEYQESD